MRGGRQVDRPFEHLVTRPANLATKKAPPPDSKALTSGVKPASFLANYFQIKTVPDWVLHQYRVDIAPEENRTGTRRFLVRAHRAILGGYLFDGTVLYTAERLTTPQNPTVTLTSEDPQTGVIYTITIRHVGEVAYGDYAYIQVYNLLLRACIEALQLKLVGRDYYDPSTEISIPAHGLKLWKGIKASIRQNDGGILLCCDISFKVMRHDTAYEILRQCLQRNPQNYQDEFEKEILGCVVLTNYNNKTYQICDVAWGETPLTTFSCRNEDVTFADYIRSRYQIEIMDLKQPLLTSRARARDIRAGMEEFIKLIPELCYCTGITDAMRADMNLMRDLAVYTRVSPDARIKALMEFNRKLVTNEQAFAQLKKFEMSLDTNLVRIQARIDQQQDILLGQNRSIKSGPKADWGNVFASRGNSLFNPKDILTWFIIVPQRDRDLASAFVVRLQGVCQTLGMIMAQPTMCTLRSGGTGADYTEQLNRVTNSAQPQIIMCVVPGKKLDVYAAIKKKCCVDRAVPTQVIMTKTLRNDNLTIATKVAVQMCCKLGGAPWAVKIPLSGLMVVGFDVCHVKTPQGSRSFGAMVASLDEFKTRYFSSVAAHPFDNVQELSSNIAINITRAVLKYKEVNGGQLPARIVIYRDGVGDGQISHVFHIELELVKKALHKLYDNQSHVSEVKMTFIIVTKRINSRIFTDKHMNPPPGTIVDDVITDPEKYDFFLVSQNVNSGTATPTAYNVIYDTINMPAERVQKMTYMLCHMYYNWNGTVRVPAPVQYAHKLAFLVGQAIKVPPNEQLDNLLYFL